MTLDDVKQAIAAQGLSYRGALHAGKGDVPEGAETLVLVGMVGSENWDRFAASPEAQDRAPDPLDRWSRRVISIIARELGASPHFPFDGPPFLPFQRWARQAEPVHPSPLGLLIHPDWGLWHAWRGALAFREHLALPPPDRRPSPCHSCADKPCLNACPVGAFTAERYDTAACTAHIAAKEGRDCLEFGCRARRACAVGSAYRYRPDHAEFHMRAFLRAQSR